jgi:hypothetical protein
MSKMPEVDLRKWGDRIIGDASQRLPTPGTLPSPTTDKPTSIRIPGYDVARLYADHANPYHFAQFLLERFKHAGVPVEGVVGVRLRLNRGKIFKLRSKPGDDSFRYCWLPDEHADALAVSRYEGALAH